MVRFTCKICLSSYSSIATLNMHVTKSHSVNEERPKRVLPEPTPDNTFFVESSQDNEGVHGERDGNTTAAQLEKAILLFTNIVQEQ